MEINIIGYVLLHTYKCKIKVTSLVLSRRAWPVDTYILPNAKEAKLTKEENEKQERRRDRNSSFTVRICEDIDEVALKSAKHLPKTKNVESPIAKKQYTCHASQHFTLYQWTHMSCLEAPTADIKQSSYKLN